MTIAVGDSLTGPAQRVDPAMMHVWAKALRDPNRIHLDSEVVRARGLGDRVINQGPANISYVMNFLLASFSGARLAGIKVRFLDNVYGDEIVTPAAVIREVEEAAGERRISLTITLHAEGRLVLDGEAAVVAPRRIGTQAY